MKLSSTRKFFSGLAALVVIMVADATAQTGSPWYWDGSVNEWNANYSADPLNNHWLVEFGGAMNEKLPNGQFNSTGGSEIYVNAGKVSFSSATYLAFNGQMKSQINVSGGEVEWNAGYFNAESGANITGTGILTVNGGEFGDSHTGYGNVTVSGGGKAYFKGGTVSSVAPTVGVGGEVFVQGSNVTQTWSLSHGSAADPATILMNVESGQIAGISAQQGTVYQTGGTVTGNVTVGRREHWHNVAAYYYLGDEQGNTGTISGSGSLIVGGKANWGDAGYPGTTMTAEFRGHGSVTIATVDNNRSVIADGYGADRTLDLSGVTTVSNTYNGVGAPFASATDGWYAVNGGKLLFPTVTVDAGASTFNVGDNAADAQNTLINSVNLAFTDVAGGDLSVALLAPDRTDLGKNEFNVDNLSLYDFDTSGGFDFGAGSVVLTFRYDNVLADSLGLTEEELKIWHRTDTAWVNVTASVDTENYLITTTALDSFSMFATAFDSPIFIPEPTSLALLGLGALAMLKRRGR